MNDVRREVFEIERAGESGELMRESWLRHRKAKLQSAVETRVGNFHPTLAGKVGALQNPARREQKKKAEIDRPQPAKTG